MICIFLFVFSLLLVMDIDSLNRGFDVFVPVYIAACVIIIFMYNQQNVEEAEFHRYVFKKKSKVSVIPPGNWKEKFFGRWEKLTRTNFAEFLQFIGAPSMLIYMAKDANFGQELIDCEGDGTTLRLNAFGVPSLDGVPCIIGSSEETAVFASGKDGNNRPYMIKFWWDEAAMSLKSKFDCSEKDLFMDQSRSIDENDVMHFTNFVYRKDGSNSTYTATLKKT